MSVPILESVPARDRGRKDERREICALWQIYRCRCCSLVSHLSTHHSSVLNQLTTRNTLNHSLLHWQTTRKPEYPWEIVLDLISSPNNVVLDQIGRAERLSHCVPSLQSPSRLSLLIQMLSQTVLGVWLADALRSEHGC
jgi:hypothetical protein